jgi:hypothetical protein
MSFSRPAARCRISTEAAPLQVGGHEAFAQAGGRPSDEYWLNEAQTLLLCMPIECAAGPASRGALSLVNCVGAVRKKPSIVSVWGGPYVVR